MNKTTKVIIAIVIVAIVALGAWAFANMKKPADQNKVSENTSSQTEPNPPAPEGQSNVGAVIVYNEDGFSPGTFTVKSGQTIKILNETDETIEFASDPHPTHTINPEMNSGDIAAGGTKEVTVTRKGEWGFHNHFNPSKRGTVTVE